MIRLSHPLKEGTYRLTSPYGPRIDPITGAAGASHNGLDMAAPTGTPIYAAAPGTVSKTYSGHSVNGNGVILRHSSTDNIIGTAYIHMDQVMVRDGQQVRRGKQIGTVGSTGRSTGPHLHFIVYGPGWQTQDPAPLISGSALVRATGAPNYVLYLAGWLLLTAGYVVLRKKKGQ
jgi:murein DD-endopeptidase MepM/ murein hydrolase activator NlpD